jgi:hypothetical protein
VYNALDGTPIAEFNVNTVNSFASNAMAAAPNNNLFTVTGQQTALIRVRTPSPQGVSSSNAILRQRVTGSKLVLGVPPVLNALGTQLQGGTQIPVAVGDLMSATYLFIANVSGQTQAVDVYFGTRGAPGAGKYTNGQLPPNAVWQVQLQAGDGDQNVIIGSTGNVIAQIAIDDGNKVDETMLLPC